MRFGLKEKKRILIALLAVLGMGLSVSFLLRVDMGTDPYTCMNNGAAAKLGISFGTWQAALNIILLIIVFLCDKKQIGWGTVFNMFLVGYVSDFVTWVTDKLVANDVFTVISVRIVIMLIALIVFVIAAALYMSAGMGVAPYDAINFIIADKIPKVPFKITRICVDALGCFIGYLLGSTVGVVTVLIVLTLGPAVQWMKEKMDALFA